MPNRIIRESCTTSPTLAALSHGAERCFWRLTTIADDRGRFYADCRVLRSKCFPRQTDEIPISEVEAWMIEWGNVDLVRFYTRNGRAYGYFPTWPEHQRLRNKTSKFPEPAENEGRRDALPIAANCGDLRLARAGITPAESESESETEVKRIKSQPSAATARFYQADFDKFWQTYKATGANRGSKARAIDQWRKALANGLDPSKAITCLEWQISCRRDREAAGEWVEQFKHAERWLRHGLYKQPDYFDVEKATEAPLKHFRADDFEKDLAAQEPQT